MIITIIFLALTILFVVWMYKDKENEMILGFTSLCLSVLFTLSIFGVMSKESRYDDFLMEKNVLEITYVKEKVYNWNLSLAKMQKNNQDWLFDEFIDDRIDYLQPIQTKGVYLIQPDGTLKEVEQ